MYKIMMVFMLSILYQTAVNATEPVQSETTSVKKEPELITPAVGSQYNLDGMKTRDGKYKSSYSTKSVDNRDPAVRPLSNPYDSNRTILPVAPVIVITDE